MQPPRRPVLDEIIAREESGLSPAARRSRRSVRLKPEAPSPFRTAYQLDCDRIIHTRAFRRLAHKTQVFTAASGDHFRTRLTHTLEVSQIARALARALRLNEDLCEAAAMGHDLGHAPFGHAGEKTLNSLCPGGFAHQLQSLRVVDVLANDGRGLNLTLDSRDGILKHSKGRGPIFVDPPEGPLSFEGMVTRVSDIIAYLAHDMDDAEEAGILNRGDIPREILDNFGDNAESRKDAIIRDLLAGCFEREGKPVLAFSRKMEEDMSSLREFMFTKVYRDPKVIAQMDEGRRIVTLIYRSIMKSDELYRELPLRSLAENRSEAARDFISGMTDRFAVNYARDL
ncbi:MAG: deoxyguanosinetriphosphate triphosphohydrolase [Deltaproteobacteria bacterium]|nr:deoxyguanosinetriphosphate triphosphohydrolase [Deltaproteobacteria bacterium]